MHRMTNSGSTLSLSFLSIVTLLIGQIPTASANDLASHRAVYDIALKNASERSGIKNIVGRMVYEFTGSDCAGYTMNFRYVTRIDTGDGSKLTDQQTITFEDLKAKRFDFETKSYTDNQLDKMIKGTAGDATDGVHVQLMVPEKKDVSISASRFPTEHMVEVIDHAKNGDQFFESHVFDGSEDADKNIMTTTLIGKRVEPAAKEPLPKEPLPKEPLDAKPDDTDGDLKQAGPFATQPYWPVEMSYFEGTGGKDEVPTYRMSFKLYENGVTRDLTMDYGDFVLTGKLSSIEELKPTECKK